MSTPALARATETLIDRSDPNDPDALARWLHAESQEWVEADGVPTRLDWSHLHLSQQEHWRRMADALRAKILGEA